MIGMSRLIARFHKIPFRRTLHTSRYRVPSTSPCNTFWKHFKSPSHILFLSANTIFAIQLHLQYRKLHSITRQESQDDELSQDEPVSIKDKVNKDFLKSLPDTVEEMEQDSFGETLSYYNYHFEKPLYILTTELLNRIILTEFLKDLLNSNQYKNNNLFNESDKERMKELIQELYPHFTNIEGNLNNFQDFFGKLSSGFKDDLLEGFFNNTKFVDVNGLQNESSQYSNLQTLPNRSHYEPNSESHIKHLKRVFRNAKTKIDRKSFDINDKLELLLQIHKELKYNEFLPGAEVYVYLYEAFKGINFYSYSKLIVDVVEMSSLQHPYLYGMRVDSYIRAKNENKFMKMINTLRLNDLQVKSSDFENEKFDIMPRSVQSDTVPTLMENYSFKTSKLFPNDDGEPDDGLYCRREDIVRSLQGAVFFKRNDLIDPLLRKLIFNSVKHGTDGHRILLNHSDTTKVKRIIGSLNEQKEVYNVYYDKHVLICLMKSISGEFEDHVRLNWLLPHLYNFINLNLNESQQRLIDNSMKISNESGHLSKEIDLIFIRSLYDLLERYNIDPRIKSRFQTMFAFESLIPQLMEEHRNRVMKYRGEINTKGVKINVEHHNDLYFTPNF